MKYIRTYEELILDKEDKDILMINAFEKNKKELIISLFKTGYNPNSYIDGYHILAKYSKNFNYNNFDINIFNIILNSGVDVNCKDKLGNTILNDIICLYNKKYTNTKHYFNVIKTLIKAGATMMIDDNDSSFEHIEYLYIKNKITNKLYNDFINLFKKEIPEQYQRYIDKIDAENAAEKYNL